MDGWNTNIPAPEIGTLQNIPETHYVNFLENGSKDFDLLILIYGKHTPKYKHRGAVFRKVTVRPLEEQKRNV
jgi:hypothetical protein